MVAYAGLLALRFNTQVGLTFAFQVIRFDSVLIEGLCIIVSRGGNAGTVMGSIRWQY